MSAALQLRPVFKQVARIFQLPVFQVEERLGEPLNLQELEAFQLASGPNQLLICRHPESVGSVEGAVWDGAGLCITQGDVTRFEGKGVLLMKSTEGLALDASNVEKEVLIRWVVSLSNPSDSSFLMVRVECAAGQPL